MPDQPPVEEQTRPGDRAVMVIFGASGDLTKRMLIPALYNLAKKKLLPQDFALVGFAIDKLTEEEYGQRVRQDLQEFAGAPDKCEFCDWLLERLYYRFGDFRDPAVYVELKTLLAEVDKKHGTHGNCLYYLAIPPSLISEVIKQLGAAGLTDQSEGCWRRVVIEKPFGDDLASAHALNREVASVLAEDQIYRIDHYLGKETVQNILVFRFANGIFEPIWNRRYIDHVQITVAESLGVEHRGAYYEHAGALCDMVPSHILQLVTLTAMEPPISFQADAVRDEQTKILNAITPFAPEDVLRRCVRGQYGEGEDGGERLAAYRSEPENRDLCRAEAGDRQLALGRRPFLHPHRETPRQARHRDRHPVSPRAVHPVSRYSRRAAHPQSAGAQHPARRRHFAPFQRQGAGAAGSRRRRQHGFRVRRLLRQGAQHRL
jgi:glucose-6-phosphate 1-dehydrogenase